MTSNKIKKDGSDLIAILFFLCLGIFITPGLLLNYCLGRCYEKSGHFSFDCAKFDPITIGASLIFWSVPFFLYLKRKNKNKEDLLNSTKYSQLRDSLKITGLSDYFEKFIEQGFADSTLDKITDSDLQHLGIAKVGARMKLLNRFKNNSQKSNV
jgi:hypothetical protein